jgi:REP element-mobilizing transposase RayT
MPERLRRLDYTFQRRPIYFVTACTHQRENILDRADIHTRLGQFGKEGPEHGAWLGAYVLMPDHFHGFVVIDDQRLDLSAWMKSLKNAFSKVLRVHNVPSPHWQRAFPYMKLLA